MNTERWVDLHVHTTHSDGTDTPEQVVERALRKGVTLLAIADHNTDSGVPEARQACERRGIVLLPAVEIDLSCPRGELHLLVYGADTTHPALRRIIDRANGSLYSVHIDLLQNLARDGIFLPVEPAGLTGAQLHVAIRTALLAAGHAQDRRDVYRKFLANPTFRRPGDRLDGDEVLSAAIQAGGVVSLAHPCKLRVDDEATVRGLAAEGLWGLEIYYGDGGEAYIPRGKELATRYGLHPTIGSDFHGGDRNFAVGMRVPEDPSLHESLAYLEEMAKRR